MDEAENNVYDGTMKTCPAAKARGFFDVDGRSLVQPSTRIPLRIRSFCKRWIGLVAGLLFVGLATPQSYGATLTKLVSFNGTNGYIQAPYATYWLAEANDGNFYGMTWHGGASYGIDGGNGTIFKMTPAGALTTLISFNGTNGFGSLSGGLIQGSNNWLYGTCSTGGPTYAGPTNQNTALGTIFKLDLIGNLTILVAFDGTNGRAPAGGLALASDGKFYGTTCYSVDQFSSGTVFRMTPTGDLTTVATIPTFDGNGNSSRPYGGLIQGADGNFYGWGGWQKILKATSSGTVTEFKTITNTSTAVPPFSRLLNAADGNLYGVAECGVSNYYGSIFKLTLGGDLTTLFAFNGTNGAGPRTGLIQGTDGNFYGTTTFGGPDYNGVNNNGHGTVFRLTPGGVLTTLFAFDGTNGAAPVSELLQASDGHFYGMTAQGGDYGMGMIYRLSLQDAPSIVVQPTNQIRQAGANVQLIVVAHGQPPLNYQWRKNGVNIAGATTSTLTLNSVGASDWGSYSVLVWNTYDSVTSATAELKLLADPANGIQSTQAAVPQVSPPQSGQNNLVIVTHGWEAFGSDPTWVDTMASTISAKLASQGLTSWQVVPIKWTEAAWGTPLMALIGARIEGALYGAEFSQVHWQHIHLIAHSAGAVFIEAFAKEIKAIWPDTEIHCTFLDPYLSINWLLGKATYGQNADWSDSYFSSDDTSILTQGRLTHAHNVDVTWLDTVHISFVTNYCYPSGMAETTPSTVYDQQVPCSVQAYVVSSHGWPIDFFQATITNGLSGAMGYGFPLSKEGGGWTNRSSYPTDNVPVVLNGQLGLRQNILPSQVRLSVPFSLLPNATSSSGVLFQGNGGAGLSSVYYSQSSPSLSRIHPLGGGGLTTGTNVPAWLVVGLTVTDAVNFVQFDASFNSTNTAEGLLTVYWDTNQIGMMDERVADSGLQTYQFALPGSVANGLYVLGFRLDSFTTNSSSLTITNVATGFVGVDQPTTLSVALFTNNTPILQLTGASNYNYLVQSSTNLIDWTPVALLVNSNGTVFFADPTAKNFPAQFYRALIP